MGYMYLQPIQFNACPLAASLCFFHRMVRALRYYWDTFQEEDPARFVLSSGENFNYIYRKEIINFIIAFDPITSHAPISAQSSNAVVFRLQPVYFLSTSL